MTAQKIEYDSFPTSSGLDVSQYSQVMTRIEVSGSDAIMAANMGVRLASSDTPETITAVIRTLIKNLTLFLLSI